jgi:hypothetical protein
MSIHSGSVIRPPSGWNGCPRHAITHPYQLLEIYQKPAGKFKCSVWPVWVDRMPFMVDQRLIFWADRRYSAAL